MQYDHVPCVLTIAGSDSSGGAGIQADIKTISALGCYAASVITMLTAQNTQGVQAICPVEPSFVQHQLASVFTDLSVAAVKIGALYHTAIIEVVAAALRLYHPPVIILDPVMLAKNGSILLQEDSLLQLKSQLFPLATLITPNRLEAEKLIGMKITNQREQAYAATLLGQQYNTNVLVKGGHMEGEQASDVLYDVIQDKHDWFHAEKIHSHNTHGTGCSLSSAIAAYLGLGCPLSQAICDAKRYLTCAIAAAADWQFGHGHGPINHFYFLKSLPTQHPL